jgi:predicted RNase H-like HicB family nuclease
MSDMTEFRIEFDREADGRWIAEIPALPGALCYGTSKGEAAQNVESLALLILADRLKHSV